MRGGRVCYNWRILNEFRQRRLHVWVLDVLVLAPSEDLDDFLTARRFSAPNPALSCEIHERFMNAIVRRREDERLDYLDVVEQAAGVVRHRDEAQEHEAVSDRHAGHLLVLEELRLDRAYPSHS